MINIEKSLDLAVNDVMTREVMSVDIDDQIQEVQHLMASKHIRHAPVLKEGKLVGILSLTDLQRMNFANTYGEDETSADDAISSMFTAGSVMHEHPVTIQPNASLKEVAKMFVDHEFHALPVVEKDELVGIITTTDVLRTLI